MSENANKRSDHVTFTTRWPQTDVVPTLHLHNADRLRTFGSKSPVALQWHRMVDEGFPDMTVLRLLLFMPPPADGGLSFHVRKFSDEKQSLRL